MQISRRSLVCLAVIFYTASLVLPVGGKWFAGLGLMVVSTFGSIFFAGALFSPNAIPPLQQAKGVAFLLLPAFNLLIIYGLLVMRRDDHEPQTLFKVLSVLAAFTAIYVVFGFMRSVGIDAGSRERDILQSFCIWTASLLTLAIASWMPSQRASS